MILDMNKIAAEIDLGYTAFGADVVSTLLRTVERLSKVADTAKAVVARHDWDANIPGTTVYEMRLALMAAGTIGPVEQIKEAKPLILYFANDEDRAGFVELVKSDFTNPVEMDVP